MKLDNKKIAVVGLGYVGLPLAVEFGKVKPVLGFDINDACIAELRSGKDSTLEVTPEELDVAQGTIGMMGITFKENCPDIRNSKVTDLVKELNHWGVNVVVTDPWANADEVEHEYGIKLGSIDSQNQVDSLVVAVGHAEFREMQPEAMRTLCKAETQPILGDLKSLFDRQACSEMGFKVFR